MNQKQFKIICAILLCISAISTQAQFICELESRTPIVNNNIDNFEFSALAYYSTQDHNIFFMPLDSRQQDSQQQDTRMQAYDVKTGTTFNVDFIDSQGKDATFNTAGATFPQSDFEGLTWLEQDYFVLLEEKENEIYFLQYVHSININNRKFRVLGSHSTGIPIVVHDENGDGIKNDRDGLEGAAYNRHTKTLYLVSEIDYKLHSIPIELPKANNNYKGKLLQGKSSVQLPFGAGSDASGIFHLSMVVDEDHPLSDNILVLSHELQRVYEFQLNLNANNQLTNNSLQQINEFRLSNEPQAEGIVADGDKLYIASELRSGGLHSYSIKTESDSCNDANSSTINDRYDPNCNCVGDIPGCINNEACNFNPSATVSNGSCTFAEPNFDCDNKCIVVDDACDDGNSLTINDSYNANCDCIGYTVPGCIIGNACNYNPSATVNDGSCIFAKPNFDCDNKCTVVDDACDDGDIKTENDTYNENCECEGKLICQADVVINTNISGATLQNSYESSQSIQTAVIRPTGIDVIIRKNETVNLNSGKITLNKGFTVENGGCLNAEIKPCQ